MSERNNPKFWAQAPRAERPKTMEEFRGEVLAKIGVDFEAIPVGSSKDLIGSASLLAFEDWRILGVGTPTEDQETGEEIYHEFLKVDVSAE